MILYDFKCPNGHVTERLVKPDTPHVRCKCGEEATRTISAIAFHLEGHSGHFPRAHARWVKEREMAGKKI